MLLVWEYDGLERQAEHVLTMASYNVQDPAQFTEATLAGLQAVFIERLNRALRRFAVGSERLPQAQHARSGVRRSENSCCAVGHDDRRCLCARAARRRCRAGASLGGCNTARALARPVRAHS